jgi:hypothetical protein
MNVVDAHVTEIITPPYFNDKYKDEGRVWWAVEVEYNSWGVKSKTILTFKTKAEAEKVDVGYHFLT